MSSDTDGPATPRRGVVAGLLIVGVIGVGFAAWRLAAWAAGPPDRLLDIGDTGSPRLIAEGEEDLARTRRAAEAARAGGDPRAVAAAEESLRVREASQEALVAAWDVQVRQARRGELGYVGIGALVGGYGLWAGGRLLRARRAAQAGPAAG